MENIKAYGICLYQSNQDNTKILLCKSISSLEKWGCLKGVQESNESIKQTAQREFYEECHIKVPLRLLTHYFEQINDSKDIGIYLVDAKNIKDLNRYFFKDILHDNYLSWENSKVKFFNINNLPAIKKKQSKLLVEIIDSLKSKNLPL